jgi:hypothetical protein
MDNCKELIDKYNQDYRLDKETKQKAEELFMEYISKKQNASSVRVQRFIFESRILMSIPYHFPPSILFASILTSPIYSQRTVSYTSPCETPSSSPPKASSSKPSTTS